MVLDFEKRLATLQGFKLRQGSSVVEQRTHKPLVVSSNLTLGTITFKKNG